MAKQFYFKHDGHARNDSKIKRLSKRYGMEGYGCFMVLLEVLLYENKHRFLLDEGGYEVLSDEMRHVDVERTKEIVEFMIQIELIKVEGDYIFSQRMVDCHLEKVTLKQKQSAGGKKAMAKRYSKTSTPKTEGAVTTHPTEEEIEPETLKVLMPKATAPYKNRDEKMQIIADLEKLVDKMREAAMPSADKRHNSRYLENVLWLPKCYEHHLEKYDFDITTANIKEVKAHANIVKFISEGFFIEAYERNFYDNIPKAKNKDFAITNFHNHLIDIFKTAIKKESLPPEHCITRAFKDSEKL